MADENSNNDERRKGNGNGNGTGNGNGPNNNGEVNQLFRRLCEYLHPTQQATLSCMVIPVRWMNFDLTQ